MNMINFKLDWHPRFKHCDLKTLGTLLLAEDAEYIIPRAEYNAISQAVLSRGKLSDYVFQARDTQEQIKRLKRIDELRENEILIGQEHGSNSLYKYKPAPEYRSTASEPYNITDVSFADHFTIAKLDVFSLSFATETNVEANREADQKTSPTLFNALTACVQHLSLVDTLVLTDDYLDRRLIAFHTQFKREKRHWILLKVSGLHHYMAEFDYSNEKGADKSAEKQACYLCLRTRIEKNSPVREWYKRYCKADFPCGFPVLIDEHESAATLSSLTEYSAFTQKATREHRLHHWQKGVHTSHLIVHLPQCPDCGETNSELTRSQKPTQLQDVTKVDDDDGGYRHCDRQKYLSHLEPLVDPVTGLISQLEQLNTTNSPHSLTVFQAAYLQNSYQFDQLNSDTFVQLSLGKGISKTQAKLSALGEAIERLAAQYCGDEEIIRAAVSETRLRCLTPCKLNPFSPTQYRDFSRHNNASTKRPQWVKPFNKDTSIHWVSGWSLTHNENVYIPAAHCLANTPFPDHVFSVYTHNGNASGATQEEAILQAALELIERDAAAIWWYNQIPCPGISKEIINESTLNTIHNTLSPDWEYWVLDITNDIAIPCCVAVGRHIEQGGMVMGFGAHLDPAIAATRALTEMYQLIVVQDKVSGPFDFNQIEPHPHLFAKRNSDIKRTEDFPLIQNTNIKDDILYVMEKLHQQNLEVCVYDYSRCDIPMVTLKVIVPGLCHFWPQYGNPRLFNVPVKQKWLSKALLESELNPLELYL
ncbi:Ribosomal protein S12 methylthiotransferase accessory factor YcaO [Thalassocella blandensis]|nr:Ribosomal protein S12 methylthiotransferase accessory factor YcaO [Thalassocella blandensis]